MKTDIHVYPIHDLKEHDTESSYCDCKPKLEVVEGSTIVVHNSWDGREIREHAEDYAFGVGKQ